MTAQAPTPAWLDRLAAVGWRALVTVALAVVLGTVAIELGSVTATILVSLVATAALAPTVRGLRARGLNRTLAAAAACLIGVAAIAITAVFLAMALVPNVGEVVSAFEEGVRDLRDQLVGIGAPEVVVGAYDRLLEVLPALIRIDLLVIAGPVILVGTVGILSVFLTFFLLQDGDRGWTRATASMAPRHAEAVTVSAVAGLDRVSGYLRRTALLAVVDAIVVWVALLLLGVPLAGPLAALAFLAGFVPYLGAIAAAVTIALVALAFSGPIAFAVVLLVIVATSVVSGRLLAPTALGDRVDVHPLLVLVAIPAGFILFGVLGLVALLPVIVFVLAIGGSTVVALGLEPSGGSGPSTRRADLVPAWLDRLAQWSWRLLVVIGLVWVVVQVSVSIPAVIVPLVLALVLASTLAPAMARLRRAGWPRGLAAATSTAGATIAVIVVLVVAVAWTIGPMRDLVETAVSGAEVTDLDALIGAVGTVGSAIVGAVGAAIRGLPGLLVTLVLVLLLTFFFLRDGASLWRQAIDRFVGGHRAPVDELGSRTVGVLGGYMVGTALISLFGAFTSALIMIILGLPLAVPIGILTFFGGFIPYIGSAVTTGLAVLVALAVGTTGDVVVMMIFTIVFNIVQGNFVTPLVYGRTLSLHPAIILLAIPAGGEIAGILGMFLVVPFVAIAAATWRPIVDLLGSDPTDAVPVVNGEPAPVAGPESPLDAV